MFKRFWGTEPCIPGYSVIFVRAFHFEKSLSLDLQVFPSHDGFTSFQIFPSQEGHLQDVHFGCDLPAPRCSLRCSANIQLCAPPKARPQNKWKLNLDMLDTMDTLDTFVQFGIWPRFYSTSNVSSVRSVVVPVPPELSLHFSPTLTMSCWASAKVSGSVQIFFHLLPVPFVCLSSCDFTFVFPICFPS